MTTSTLERHWIAVDGEEIVVDNQWTRQDVLDELYSRDIDPDEVDIVAVPAPHYSFFI